MKNAARRLDIIASPAAGVRALAGLVQTPEGMDVLVRRGSASGENSQGLIRAYDDKGRLLGNATFSLAPPPRPRHTPTCSLPVEILDVPTSRASNIADEKRRRRGAPA